MVLGAQALAELEHGLRAGDVHARHSAQGEDQVCLLYTSDICGINLRKADVDYMVYMIKYDSVFRQFIGTVEREDQNLIVNGHRIRVFSEADAAMIPWESCGAEYVLSLIHI